MALIACPECVHRISSFARFCPKCGYQMESAAQEAPALQSSTATEADVPENAPVQPVVDRVISNGCEELLQAGFMLSQSETVIMEARTFLVLGLFSVSDGYAYLTNKRFVLCDASGIDIVFQVVIGNLSSVEEARHLISKKIIIRAGSGDSYHIKCMPHHTWFEALSNPRSVLDAQNKGGGLPPTGTAGVLDWFYEANASAVGPIHEDSMVQLVRDRVVTRDTNVWNKSLPGWKPAEETILTIYINEPDGSRMPKSSRKGDRFFRSRIHRLYRKYF